MISVYCKLEVHASIYALQRDDIMISNVKARYSRNFIDILFLKLESTATVNPMVTCTPRQYHTTSVNSDHQLL